MLNENTVLALLQASVAGAGLVLAVFALILPTTRRIFEERSKKLLSSLNEFKNKAKELQTGSKKEEIQYLSTLMNEIKGVHNFPKYMSIGMLISFLGYVLSALISLIWLVGSYREIIDSVLPIVFSGTTIAFLVVGVISIKDAYSSLKRDLDSLLVSIEGVPEARSEES
jgi:hypothetical protein